MLSRIFGGIRMTWKRLILFAVISGVITGLIALLVPDGNSVHQIAVTFEAWIVLAVIVIVNCGRPLDAALKTFVYFLVSQPLVYLVQVPFNRLGFGLFRYYWPYWFIWTAATFPGAFIAWYIRKDNVPGALILSVALAALVWFGTDYLRMVVSRFPRYLLAMLFCYGAVPVLILAVLRGKPARLTASGIAVLVLAASLFLAFRNGFAARVGVGFGLDPEKYPVTGEWTAQLADPGNGTVTLIPGDDIISTRCQVEIIDLSRPADIILTDPEGNTLRIPARVVETGSGKTVVYGQEENP